MDIYVALLLFFLFTKPAFGFGSDQDYQIDIISELDLANATYGITQVAGLHNGSKAFLFRDVGRAVHAPPHITERVVQLFRSKSEFTFLATIQQKSSTSGVIFSIHESEHRNVKWIFKISPPSDRICLNVVERRPDSINTD